ncbi:hypothetical protein ATK78_2767 [Pedobacter metabolipauper]|uniref:Uncharacterized protein n=1 Tax=Pedobacter metabolipauper TaxID=425513 RepID=A0A4R6SUZ2_9SPHI|nr:hypothetical protein ATK78_2767 [Pedobacter metabolipauper]
MLIIAVANSQSFLTIEKYKVYPKFSRTAHRDR